MGWRVASNLTPVAVGRRFQFLLAIDFSSSVLTMGASHWAAYDIAAGFPREDDPRKIEMKMEAEMSLIT